MEREGKELEVQRLAAPARPDALAILGAELLLVGGLAAGIVGRVRFTVVVDVCWAIAAALGLLALALRRSVWRPTANAVLALLLSFASTLPGISFFVELPNRNGVICYELASFKGSLIALLVGPVLFLVSLMVSPLRPMSLPLLTLRVLHALIWLVGTGNTLLCAMTV